MTSCASKQVSQSSRVYVSRKGQCYGPYSIENARKFVEEGSLVQEDYATLEEGNGEWKRLQDLLNELTRDEQKENGNAMMQRIIELLDKEETDFAFDLVKGADDLKLYESLLEGAKVKEGVLCEPDWVGWEGYRQVFFMKLMEASPDTRKASELRKGARMISMRFFEDEEFPLEVLQFENLEFLHLRGGKMQSVPPEITRLSGLEDLYLEDVELTRLPRELKELKALRRLDLPGNQLGGPNSNLEVLSEMKNLEILLLSYNELPCLPRGILPNLKKLSSLTLNGNELSQEGLFTILEELSELPDVSELFLRRCEIDNFPQTIKGFSGLIKMDLAENQLDELPVWLGELASLKWIDLSGNPVQKELNWDKDIDFTETVNGKT